MLKTAALFVGSVVGAGFATGQEVKLFFGADGVANVAVAALFMAVCAFAFLQMGAKRREENPKLRLAVGTAVSLCSFAVYAAMIAAAEALLLSWTGVNGLSIPLAVGMMFLSGERTASLSLLNLFAVPFMVVIVVMVGVRSGGCAEGGFHLIRSLAYGGMNLLFSGALLIKEGEEITAEERLGASLLSGVILFGMLLFMRRCVCGFSGEMPFLSAAIKAGLKTPARLALLLAIITTMASCAYLSVNGVTALTGDRAFAASIVTLLGVLVAAFGFEKVVKTAYPVVSCLGLVFTLGALCSPAFRLIKKRVAAREHSH